jgi:CDP-2,3-bis-(O-geranylgeranyl)-sn-glycerol synthase
MSAWSCAIFLIVALSLAGVAQTIWFASPASQRFALPIDGGFEWHGRRLLGDHKTLRGFVVMVPASAASFTLLAAVIGDPAAIGLWPIPLAAYAGLGAVAGLGFMLGELPNSFVKRRLGVDPGAAGGGRWGALQFLFDRVDSGLGMLAAVSIASATPPLTWFWLLVVGPAIHWAFSVLMFHLGLKARPA